MRLGLLTRLWVRPPVVLGWRELASSGGAAVSWVFTTQATAGPICKRYAILLAKDEHGLAGPPIELLRRERYEIVGSSPPKLSRPFWSATLNGLLCNRFSVTC